MLNLNIPTMRSDSVDEESSSLPLNKRNPDIIQRFTETYCNKCNGYFGKVEEGPVMFSYNPGTKHMIWWHMRGCRSFYTRKTMTNRYRLNERQVD